MTPSHTSTQLCFGGCRTGKVFLPLHPHPAPPWGSWLQAQTQTSLSLTAAGMSLASLLLQGGARELPGPIIHHTPFRGPGAQRRRQASSSKTTGWKGPQCCSDLAPSHAGCCSHQLLPVPGPTSQVPQALQVQSQIHQPLTLSSWDYGEAFVQVQKLRECQKIQESNNILKQHFKQIKFHAEQTLTGLCTCRAGPVLI